MATVTITAERLRDVVRRALLAAGVPEEPATVEAELMVDADLCGVPSHGVLMLPRLLAGLREGRVAPAPELALVRQHGATCVMDGGNGPGRWVARSAMEAAMARAAEFGIGACLAVRTTHWGRAHAYVAHAARRGFVGLCTTNAIPTLAPAGAMRAVLGNNPLAIGVPRADGTPPVVLDLAMTQAAFGKVATYKREGRLIPPDWGTGPDGKPTRDAGAILASGMLLPMGGHKGTGLALMFELLTAGLSGGPFGHEIYARDASGIDADASKLFVAFDVNAFGARAALTARIDDLLAWLRAAMPDQDIVAPGERGWQERAQALREGLTLHAGIVEQLAAVGVEVADAPGTEGDEG